MAAWLSNRAVAVVDKARREALEKHGPLKPGAVRWMRLLGEEFREVCAELALVWHQPLIARIGAEQRAISELAQLAQLCIGVIEILQEEEANGRPTLPK